MIYVVDCACGCGTIFETTYHRQKYIREHYNKHRRDEHKSIKLDRRQCSLRSCNIMFIPKYKRQRFCKPEHATEFKKDQEADSIFIRIPKHLLSPDGNCSLIITFVNGTLSEIASN